MYKLAAQSTPFQSDWQPLQKNDNAVQFFCGDMSKMSHFSPIVVYRPVPPPSQIAFGFFYRVFRSVYSNKLVNFFVIQLLLRIFIQPVMQRHSLANNFSQLSLVIAMVLSTVHAYYNVQYTGEYCTAAQWKIYTTHLEYRHITQRWFQQYPLQRGSTVFHHNIRFLTKSA